MVADGNHGLGAGTTPGRSFGRALSTPARTPRTPAVLDVKASKS